MNLLGTENDCIEYIHSAGRFGRKAGLENIRALLEYLGNPQEALKSVHIAGTNGKGSVACMISSVLTSAGFKVGMNTSPYIEHFSERLCIDGTPIEPEKLIKYTNIVSEAVKKLSGEGYFPIEFEIIAAIGFLYFKDENCDFAVLECGLGGRFDATNVISSPQLCVISSIGLDHTEILGDTIEKIAFEKAGIIKPGCPAVTHPNMDKAALNVIKRRASELGSPVFETEKNAVVKCAGLFGTKFSLDGTDYTLGLRGSFQVGNAALAIHAARILSEKYPISQDNLTKGIAAAEWKCRFEYIKSENNYIIDGAHNLHGICAFAQSVEKCIGREEKVFVVGMLNDKNFASCAQRLASLGGTVIVTDVPNARQTSGEEVFRCFREYAADSLYIPDFKKALQRAGALIGDGGFICVTGSLYLAGAVRKYVKS